MDNRHPSKVDTRVSILDRNSRNQALLYRGLRGAAWRSISANVVSYRSPQIYHHSWRRLRSISANPHVWYIAARWLLPPCFAPRFLWSNYPRLLSGRAPLFLGQSCCNFGVGSFFLGSSWCILEFLESVQEVLSIVGRKLCAPCCLFHEVGMNAQSYFDQSEVVPLISPRRFQIILANHMSSPSLFL